MQESQQILTARMEIYNSVLPTKGRASSAKAGLAFRSFPCFGRPLPE